MRAQNSKITEIADRLQNDQNKNKISICCCCCCLLRCSYFNSLPPAFCTKPDVSCLIASHRRVTHRLTCRPHRTKAKPHLNQLSQCPLCRLLHQKKTHDLVPPKKAHGPIPPGPGMMMMMMMMAMMMIWSLCEEEIVTVTQNMISVL